MAKEEALVKLDGAFHTAATELLDEALKVVLAVVIGDFFSFLDVPLGHDKDATPTIQSLTVGTTGVVGVAGSVVARTAIDVPAGIHIEHVAVVTFIPYRSRDSLTDVLDDSCPLFDRGDGKEA